MRFFIPITLAVLSVLSSLSLPLNRPPTLLPHYAIAQFFPGERGPPGPPGKSSMKNLIIREVDGNSVRIKGIVSSLATCNNDEFVSGGGFSIKNGFGFIIDSHQDRNSWNVTAANPFSVPNGTLGQLQAHAECAKIQ